MRKILTSTMVIFAVFVVALVPAVQSGAITNGVPDGDGHPNVGTIVWKVYPDWQPNEGIFWDWYCTGSLLAPDLYLTAAHCVTPMIGYLDRGILHSDEIYVTFDFDLHRDPDAGIYGGIHPDEANLVPVESWDINPRFRCNASTCYFDMAVLHLAEPVEGIDPIVLPTLGFLDERAEQNGLRGHAFVNVGYGSGAVDRSIWSPNVTVTYSGYREVSTSPFMALNKTHLFLLDNHAATGMGGGGFGDSGSPNFFEEEGELRNLVVALDTSGDPKAQALSMNWRLDTPAAREFLDDYVTLP